ncbi:hypothetical protein PAPHI01_0586 [Pancytospora philotis]|nr:hypothetical protein PAPHI01_0586 [Pancytospora philotis]
MKQYKLVYDPADKVERCIFSNIHIAQLAEPVSIAREEPVQIEEQEFSKKKSEVLDYEDEAYAELKSKEQLPYVVSDGDSRCYAGKLQSVDDSGSVYFAFINMGSYLKLVPVSRWYGFVQKNHFADGNVEGLDKSLNTFDFANDDSSASDQEIDYEAEFDDDDGDEQIVEVSREKRLTLSGKELQGILETYEREETEADAAKAQAMEGSEAPADEGEPKRMKTNPALTKDEIRKIFGKGKISVKDLLKSIKGKFKLEDAEKTMIREFIHDSCVFETDPITSEKLFKLKKL